MGWNYKDGDWYVNEAGNSIFYIENNPCRCCSNAYMVEYRSPVTGNKTTKFDVFSHEEFHRIVSHYKLIKLDNLEESV
jgi:hypothetical protein